MSLKETLTNPASETIFAIAMIADDFVLMIVVWKLTK